MAKGFGYKYSEGKVHFTIKYGPIIAGLVVNGEWRRIQFRHVEAGANAIKSLEKAGMYEQFMGYMNKLEEVPDEYFMTLYDGHLGPYIKDYIPSDVKREDFGKVRFSNNSIKVDDYYIASGIATGRSALSRVTTYDTEAQPDRIPYTLREYERVISMYANHEPVRRGARVSSPNAPQQWIRGDWAEIPAPTIEIGTIQAIYAGQPIEYNPGRDAYRVTEPDGTTRYIPASEIQDVPVTNPDVATASAIDRAINNMRGTEQERERALTQQRLHEALDRVAGISPSRRNRNNL